MLTGEATSLWILIWDAHTMNLKDWSPEDLSSYVQQRIPPNSTILQSFIVSDSANSISPDVWSDFHLDFQWLQGDSSLINCKEKTIILIQAILFKYSGIFGEQLGVFLASGNRSFSSSLKCMNSKSIIWVHSDEMRFSSWFQFSFEMIALSSFMKDLNAFYCGIKQKRTGSQLFLNDDSPKKEVMLTNERSSDVSKLNDVPNDVSKLNDEPSNDVPKLTNERSSDVSKLNDEPSNDVSKLTNERSSDVSKLNDEPSNDVSKLTNERSSDVPKSSNERSSDVPKLNDEPSNDFSKLNYASPKEPSYVQSLNNSNSSPNVQNLNNSSASDISRHLDDEMKKIMAAIDEKIQSDKSDKDKNQVLNISDSGVPLVKNVVASDSISSAIPTNLVTIPTTIVSHVPTNEIPINGLAQSKLLVPFNSTANETVSVNHLDLALKQRLLSSTSVPKDPVKEIQNDMELAMKKRLAVVASMKQQTKSQSDLDYGTTETAHHLVSTLTPIGKKLLEPGSPVKVQEVFDDKPPVVEDMWSSEIQFNFVSDPSKKKRRVSDVGSNKRPKQDFRSRKSDQFSRNDTPRKDFGKGKNGQFNQRNNNNRGQSQGSNFGRNDSNFNNRFNDGCNMNRYESNRFNDGNQSEMNRNELNRQNQRNRCEVNRSNEGNRFNEPDMNSRSNEMNRFNDGNRSEWNRQNVGNRSEMNRTELNRTEMDRTELNESNERNRANQGLDYFPDRNQNNFQGNQDPTQPQINYQSKVKTNYQNQKNAFNHLIIYQTEFVTVKDIKKSVGALVGNFTVRNYTFLSKCHVLLIFNASMGKEKLKHALSSLGFDCFDSIKITEQMCKSDCNYTREITCPRLWRDSVQERLRGIVQNWTSTNAPMNISEYLSYLADNIEKWILLG